MKPTSLHEIKDLLLNNYSKNSCDILAQEANLHRSVCVFLVDLVKGPDPLLAQRAAWSIGILGDINPDRLKPFCSELITALNQPHHDAVARNVVRVWQTMELPDEFLGEIFEICYNYLANPHVAVAIRAFSATVCGRICSKYPELKTEILEMLPVWKENAPPAIRVRIRQLEKELL
ncbi:MAG: hypothetical protein IPH36_18925 [Saprospiraceae bacterium]|nr:hypothetical protein [Saprospiraceae bacterium]MBK7789540.1 hypothetical protein [Saprospiraceae bacterium]